MNNDNSLLLPEDDTPVRADARRNRELLLETAHRLFTTEGVESTSMTAIADAAGVGKGTLYRHFTNKADLCIALLDEDMRDLQCSVLKHLRQNDTPIDNLKWFVEQILDFVTRNETLLLVENDGHGTGLDHQAHIWWRQTVIGLLSQILPGKDVRYFADVLYVMLDVRTLHFQRTALGYNNNYILGGLKQTVDAFTNIT